MVLYPWLIIFMELWPSILNMDHVLMAFVFSNHGLWIGGVCPTKSPAEFKKSKYWLLPVIYSQQYYQCFVLFLNALCYVLGRQIMYLWISRIETVKLKRAEYPFYVKWYSFWFVCSSHHKKWSFEMKVE